MCQPAPGTAGQAPTFAPVSHHPALGGGGTARAELGGRGTPALPTEGSAAGAAAAPERATLPNANRSRPSPTRISRESTATKEGF